MGSSHCEQMLRNNEDEWKNAGTWGDFFSWQPTIGTDHLRWRPLYVLKIFSTRCATVPVPFISGSKTLWTVTGPSSHPGLKVTSLCGFMRSLPTLADLHVYEGRDARYAVSIDGGPYEVFSIHADDFSAEWRWNVLRDYARRTVDLSRIAEGKHKAIIFRNSGSIQTWNKALCGA